MDVAKELMFTGRIIDGSTASALGLVTHVLENPREVACRLATEIASKSPDAVGAGKELLEKSWHADQETGLKMEARLQGRLFGSPNQLEAIKADFEERVPNYCDAD